MNNHIFKTIENKIMTFTGFVDHYNKDWNYPSKITFCNGCFDILHIGHLQLLSYAKSFGDMLVVGLNSDTSVQRLKGLTRPIRPEYERAINLASLSFVDHVIIFWEDTPVQLIKTISPTRIVKGGDYDIETMPEKDIIKEYNIELTFFNFVPEKSTTNIIKNVLEKHNGSTDGSK